MTGQQANTWALSLGLPDIAPDSQKEIIRSIATGKDQEKTLLKKTSPFVRKVMKKRNVWKIPKKDYERFNSVCLKLLKKGYGNKRIIKIARRLNLLPYSHGTYQSAITKVRAANGFRDKRVMDESTQRRVILLTNKGVSIEGVAEILSLDPSDVRCRIMQEKYRAGKKPRRQRIDQYIKCCNRGLSTKQIARELGVTVCNARRQIRKYRAEGYIK